MLGKRGNELNTAPRLSTQAWRALELLDGFQHGAAEEFLMLSGFQRELLAKLVLAGFATVVTETVQTGYIDD